MGNFLEKLKIKKNGLTKGEIAELLKTNPEALEAFEKAYTIHVLDPDVDTGNLFDMDRRSAKASEDSERKKQADETGEEETEQSDSEQDEKQLVMVDNLVRRIVDELIDQTVLYTYSKKGHGYEKLSLPGDHTPVKAEEIYALPENLQPQLTGHMMKRDMDELVYPELLKAYKDYKTAKSPERRMGAYHTFRQGVDILDLDPILYEILGTNPNAMGYWFPALVPAVEEQDFFQIPDTKIIKVPLPMLQMTRLEYGTLTPTTMRIVDEYCYKVFSLEEDKDYFVKTGTFSSKYNFRNAHVKGAKEVRELGEYLLFIQSQACTAAGPLSQPSIYGISTTNEWVVREYIKDVENNPCIYQGIPLHTEYRVFVDFDTDEILGIHPYWDPDVMKRRLGHEEDADSPHNIHDYTIFQMHEETLMSRYHANKDRVLHHMKELLPGVNLSGQWSVDVMQNGNDFYIIDMALAAQSAFCECIPDGKLKAIEEDWMPRIPETGTKINNKIERR